MRAALVSRLLQAAVVVVLVVVAAFALIRLAPGDPFYSSLEEANVAPEQVARIKAHWGYDRPIPEQFARFARNLAQGDLGYSHSRIQSVQEALAATIPNTLVLVVTALGVAFAAGIALGAWQGWRAESRAARSTDTLGTVAVSVPEFVLAVLLMIGPALAWRWFPVSGMRTEFGPAGLAGLADLLWHLALPATALALPVLFIVARLQRNAMLGVRDAEFVRAARARGAGEGRAARRALRNALVPVLAYAGVHLSALVGGVVIVEKVFDWPGMGRLMVAAVHARDYQLVVGGVLAGAVCTVVGTMLADLLLLWADPRQRGRA